jgi:flagellar basal-body rod protein FlgG
MRSLSIAATGMQAQQTNVEVISNNIANMNTTAYTRRRAEFNDLPTRTCAARVPPPRMPERGSGGVQLGLGCAPPRSIIASPKTGSLTNTDNTLDLAIEGKGYFQITLPSGETAYTPRRAFQLSSTGEIVTNDGYTVQPGVTIPNNATSVTSTPRARWVKIDGQTTQTNVGALQIATFINEAGMEAIGDNLLHGNHRLGYADHPARRTPPASVRSCKATSRPRTSTWSARSPT